MSFFNKIKYSINKRLKNYTKRLAWIKYGNHTKFHFNDPCILIADKYTHGVPELYRYDNVTKLKIGKFCSIASGVKIMLGGNHHTEWVSTFAFYQEINSFSNYNKGWTQQNRGDVIIGNDVWIGRDVLILSGVRIGDGAVVGAGAVVSKDIPPYSIAVGNPIKIIRCRFNENQIKALLKISWWDWSEEKINKNINLICSSNIDEFISSILGKNWENKL